MRLPIPPRIKPSYITTPIFYVNAKPHLGHLYSMLLGDVRARWETLHQRPVMFTTGTDEHGLKIQTVAEQQATTPRQLVDSVSTNFKALARQMNINYSRFIRTTDLDHVDTVTYFWDLMMRRNMIYKGTHSGWYSVNDETFYTETQIEQVTVNGSTKMISKETKNEVVFHKESNYFFKLSHFQRQLIDYIETHEDFIIPKNKYNELLTELKQEKLADLSVSRPSSRLSWGIPVPNDSSQTIYVWFDALLNYLTCIGFPKSFKHEGETFITADDNPWPVTNIIGKDIMRFHCIYWPAFLMAAGIELPKQVLVHSHWLSEGFKMSKSLGNVVDPNDVCDIYGQDAVRFFLMESSRLSSDCNYSETSFKFTRDNIIGKYANLMTRCGGQSFNIEQSVENYKHEKFIDIESLIGELENGRDIIYIQNQLFEKMQQIPEIMNNNIMEFQFLKAIQAWWTLVENANQFLQITEPWVYNKKIKQSPHNDDYKLLQSYYIYIASEAIRITTILIQPVIPNLAGKILDRLNVADSRRHWQYVGVFTDTSYGKGANGKHDLPIARVNSE